MKTYPDEVMDMLNSGYIRECHTVDVALDFPLRFTDAGFDVSQGGLKYRASAAFQGLDQLASAAEMRVSEITLSFSMTDVAVTAAILSGDYYKRKVTFQRMFLREDNSVIFSEVIWRGSVTGSSTDDNDSQISLSVASRWAEYESVNAWRSTPLSHKKRAGSDDDAMKWAAAAADTVYWGGKAGAA